MSTVTKIGWEKVVFPAKSTTIADSACSLPCTPILIVVSQEKEYGVSESVFTEKPSIKNSTLAIPVSSSTCAAKLTTPETVWPSRGLEIIIVGGLESFGILFTKTLIEGTSKWFP